MSVYISFSYDYPRGFLQWPISADSSVSSSWIYAELTRNQLNELKKKMTPIQEIIDSLKPKKKQSLIEYLPDFDTDETDGNVPEDLENQSSLLVDDEENHIEESLSERLYKEIDEQTTTRKISMIRYVLVISCRLFRPMDIGTTKTFGKCVEKINRISSTHFISRHYSTMALDQQMIVKRNFIISIDVQ